MTCAVTKKYPRKIFLAIIYSLLFAGCASPRMAITSGNEQVQFKIPTVDIDRYEAVVYPAGPINK